MEYREQLLKLLMESLERDDWEIEQCEADIVWYNYHSPRFGNISFELDGLYNNVVVYINGQDPVKLCHYYWWLPMTELSSAINKMKERVWGKRKNRKDEKLQKAVEEYLDNKIEREA